MADPLREALAAMADRLGHYGANASDLRRLLAPHPEPAEPPVSEVPPEPALLDEFAPSPHAPSGAIAAVRTPRTRSGRSERRAKFMGRKPCGERELRLSHNATVTRGPA